MREIKTTAIVGMGALGLLYGSQIAAGLGKDAVHFVADSERVQKYQTMEFTINGNPQTFAMEDEEETSYADLVIVAVKYTALDQALETMKNAVGPETIILSVMNGITSENIIGRRYGRDKVLYTVAEGMDAMKFGAKLSFTNPGILRLGTTDENQREMLSTVERYFNLAKVPYVIDSDILHGLWGKFMLNVGINQTCMVYETDYAGALAPGKAHDTVLGAMREVVALAEKEGITLNEEDIQYYMGLLKTLSPTGVPSMRQDALSRRPSEVEMFAGTVREMSAAHGLKTPVNDFLYRRIKEMEAAY